MEFAKLEKSESNILDTFFGLSILQQHFYFYFSTYLFWNNKNHNGPAYSLSVKFDIGDTFCIYCFCRTNETDMGIVKYVTQ